MTREPENLNFCLFAECAYLEDEQCTRKECAFNAKWVCWWEHNKFHGSILESDPPEGKKAVMNIYYDPESGKYILEREE